MAVRSHREDVFWLEAAAAGVVDTDWLEANPDVCARVVARLGMGEEVPERVAVAAGRVAVAHGRDAVHGATNGLDLAMVLAGLRGVPAEVLRSLLRRFRDRRLRAAIAANPATPAPVLSQLSRYGDPLLNEAVALHPNLSPRLRERLWGVPNGNRVSGWMLAAWQEQPRRRTARVLERLCDPAVHVSVAEAMWPVVAEVGGIGLQRRVLERLLVGTHGAAPISGVAAEALVGWLGPDSESTVVDALTAAARAGAVADPEERAAAVARIQPSPSAAERAAEDPSWLAEIATCHRWWGFVTSVLDALAADRPQAARAAARAVVRASEHRNALEQLWVDDLWEVAACPDQEPNQRFAALQRLATLDGVDVGRLGRVLREVPDTDGSTMLGAWEAYLRIADPSAVLSAPASVAVQVSDKKLREVCFAALAAAGNTHLVMELREGFPGTFAELVALAAASGTALA